MRCDKSAEIASTWLKFTPENGARAFSHSLDPELPDEHSKSSHCREEKRTLQRRHCLSGPAQGILARPLKIQEGADEGRVAKPGLSGPTGAVFLSYAPQDQEVAQRICEALRAAGIARRPPATHQGSQDVRRIHEGHALGTRTGDLIRDSHRLGGVGTFHWAVCRLTGLP